MTDKVTIRKIIKEKLANIGSLLKSDFSARIAAALFSLKEYKEAQSVFIYISFADEVQTKIIIEDLFKNNKKIYVPNVSGKIMNMVLIRKDTLYTANKYGIIEPVVKNEDIYDGDIDLAIIPLISYDKNFHRLGRGGGYYDKFLYNKKCKKIALAYSIQETEKLDVEPHDIKVDMIITEEGIIK